MQFWIWIEALSGVVAGVCLAIPALRMTRKLVLIRKINKKDDNDQPSLEKLEHEWTETAQTLLSRWDRLDHVLIHVGFAAFIIGALVKVGMTWAYS